MHSLVYRRRGTRGAGCGETGIFIYPRRGVGTYRTNRYSRYDSGSAPGFAESQFVRFGSGLQTCKNPAVRERGLQIQTEWKGGSMNLLMLLFNLVVLRKRRIKLSFQITLEL